MVAATHSAPKLAPSMLAADFARLGEEARAMLDAGADWLHLDVMDGHFVPNLTIGPVVVAALAASLDGGSQVLDAHLMIDPWQPYLDSFLATGVGVLTLHAGASGDVAAGLAHIRARGVKAGLALSPGDDDAVLVSDATLALADVVLMMTVRPGFGGQTLMPDRIDAVAAMRARLTRLGLAAELEVDGGITQANAALVRAAGADILVAGSAAFAGGASRYRANLAALRGGGEGEGEGEGEGVKG